MISESYQPMICPVCGDFYFSELQEDDDITCIQCSRCGWQYDIKQACDPDLKDGRNAQSVNEYKKWFQSMIEANPDYDFSDEHYPPEEPHPCPVCGRHTFRTRDSFDICPVCGWTDDGLMEDEPQRWAGTSNDMCLDDYRRRYQKSEN
ncbi:MAG: hypothetical protein IKR95_05290 [Oscillospiraceae bacterium]|nr:hypothetical protein [Oscillospiraceae bacterium]